MSDLPDSSGAKSVIESEIEDADSQLSKLQQTRRAMRFHGWLMGVSGLLAAGDIVFGDEVDWGHILFAAVVVGYSMIVVVRSKQSIAQLQSVLKERTEALTELSEA